MTSTSKRAEKAGAARRGRKQLTTSSRLTWVALSIGALAALQLWTTWDRFSLPFLDTRLHYQYDNADFSFKARNGNRNGDLRSQLGVTVNTYSRWGEQSGKPSYYADHPFLVKALFQQFTKLVGTQEWASRVFYLGVSFAIAVGLYLILLEATGSLLASFAGTATLVSLPVFAVYQTAVKFEADGMLASVWLFLALRFYLQKGTSRSVAAYAALATAAVLTHWTAILFEATIGAYLFLTAWRKHHQRATRALLVTIVAGAVGAVLLVASMSYLQHGLAGARIALVSSFVRRSASMPAAEWWARQWTYLKANFGELFPWLALGLILVLAGEWLWSRSPKATSVGAADIQSAKALMPFFFATLMVGTLWIVAFPQGSFIHIYWQYWLTMPVAVLVAATLAPLRSKYALVAGTVAAAILIFYMLNASRVAYAEVLRDQLGTPADIDFLRSLRGDRFDRFIFVPLSDVALNPWFQGPLFQYYTDRPVSVAVAPADIRASDKVLVLRYRQRDQILAALSRWSRRTMGNEKCGDRICAYDVLSPWVGGLAAAPAGRDGGFSVNHPGPLAEHPNEMPGDAPSFLAFGSSLAADRRPLSRIRN